MGPTIYATFADVDAAARAAGALLDHGAQSEDITVLAKRAHPDSPYSSIITEDVEGGVPLTDDVVQVDPKADEGITTTTGKDAAVGAAKGAGIGLGIGAAAALASLFVPGIGLVLGGGALAAALTGAGATAAAGALAGTVTGYLKDQGMPDESVATYTDIYDQGGAILMVAPRNLSQARVEELLSKYGGTNMAYYDARVA
jgi:uncharacterized membrane protein